MRLLNTRTLQLQEFADETEVEYAILSHRWEEEEVSFQEILSPDTCKVKKGFHKIQKFCSKAIEAGYEYGWVDTCCIDKTSSAELSEAINSMFRWYTVAAICYVFLSDVNGSSESVEAQFVSSEWFKRGWTLQELVAPEQINFFDKHWKHLGSKNDLVEKIERASNIPNDVLYNPSNILLHSIAARMYWAAQRKTTRIEDMAYSLMGLFNINMPLLYGEGRKAFLRLQEEIIKHSEDDSIFAWSGVPEEGSGLLADHPKRFANGQLLLDMECGEITETPPTINSRGVCAKLRLTPWGPKTYLAFLRWKAKGRVVGIFLERLNQQLYTRVALSGWPDVFLEHESIYTTANRPFQYRVIYVRQEGWGASISRPLGEKFVEIHGVRVANCGSLPIRKIRNMDLEKAVALLETGANDFGTMVDIKLLDGRSSIVAIRIGLDFDFRPYCVLANSENIREPGLAQSLSAKRIWEVDLRESMPLPRATTEKFVEPFERRLLKGGTSRLWVFTLAWPSKRHSFYLHLKHSDQRLAAIINVWFEPDAEGRNLWNFDFELFPSHEQSWRRI